MDITEQQQEKLIELGRIIRRARWRKNLSQKELGDTFDVDVTYISHLEAGRRVANFLFIDALLSYLETEFKLGNRTLKKGNMSWEAVLDMSFSDPHVFRPTPEERELLLELLPQITDTFVERVSPSKWSLDVESFITGYLYARDVEPERAREISRRIVMNYIEV